MNPSWTARLDDVMPFGSSTCSKAPALLPDEPAVIVRGEGCRVWDALGREFIDFRNGLGPVTLGYRFRPVEEAIRRQLESGILFGQPHPLECEVAEMLRDAIPCAEQVRFLKTGGEAISACIRLARAYTGRDHVVQIDYNGWLNSLSAGGSALPGREAAAQTGACAGLGERGEPDSPGHATASPPGVPAALSALHHACGWNDLAALKRLFAEHDGQVAAVVIAADYRRMAEGRTFYPVACELTRRHGAVLIFDEIVTGFRIAIGGVQEYFGVTPDMAVFAKGIANGMPLAAYAGRRDLMQTARRAVISSTYGGETLSLAAAKATIETYREQDVITFLWKQGEWLWTRVNALLNDRGIAARVEGFWPCPQWMFDDASLPNRFFRAAYRHGLSLYSVSYINFSHGDSDVQEALRRFDAVATELATERA